MHSERETTGAVAAPVTAEQWEALRVHAYRTARVWEPNQDGYHAAMAVYAAVFGKPDGEIGVMLPNGTVVQPWEI